MVANILTFSSFNQGTTLSLHVEAQNAGILVRTAEKALAFEVFELSPTNSAVYQTRGRLIRRFPATAVQVPYSISQQASFQSVFAKTVVKMSQQTVSGTKMQAIKAKQSHDEDRDTTDPEIVTELLTSMLRGLGKPIDVEGIEKKTREEVVWGNSLLPWRRSPLWLLIRVSLQLIMGRASSNTGVYKAFMAFLLARVLGHATKLQAGSDMLRTMLAKICGRLKKLDSPRQGQWLTTIHHAVSQASILLEKRWSYIQSDCEKSLDLETLETLNPKNDTSLGLPALNEFIASLDKRTDGSPTEFHPKPSFPALDSFRLAEVCSRSDMAYLPFQLARFETWVENELNIWLTGHKDYEYSSACQRLCKILKSYHKLGQSFYKDQPEGMSRMLLVTLELWVSMDKAAVYSIPLLKKYDHEIPVDVYRSLLLSLRPDMERLRIAESYLRERTPPSPVSKPSVFTSYGAQDSFPVRYFDQFPKYKELFQRITDHATTMRQRKTEEFASLKLEYQKLMELYNSSQCQWVQIMKHRIPRKVHSQWCCHCSYLQVANALEVRIHEWPLPENNLEAKATVFELDPPPAFSSWRDTTLYLIDNVLKSNQTTNSAPTSSHPLRQYQQLSEYARMDRSLRVHLLSETKPHGVTHRNRKQVSRSTIDDICLNNGLRLQYFDEEHKRFLSSHEASHQLSDVCTLQLPSRAATLNPFLTRKHTTPDGTPPNNIIASQSECPDYMKLTEYKALATLSYGYKLQWLNILRQLAMPEINFNSAEAATFLLQSSLQAGPNAHATTERCTHDVFCDIAFAHQLAESLQESISRIEENWESYTALSVFVFLSSRLTSLGPEGMKARCLGLLQGCRDISYQWLCKMQRRLEEITDHDQRIEFQSIILNICLVCVNSFYIGQEDLASILGEPRNYSILVEISIIIANNADLLKDTDSLQQFMRSRWMHILHHAQATLVEQAIKDGQNLDLAIKRCWPAFNRSTTWTVAGPDAACWLGTKSAHMQVHVNVLTGELLVDGQPLSRLPTNYQQNPAYKALFGRAVLDVMPSPVPGMQFCSTKIFHGYTVHFGLQEASEGGRGIGGRDLLVHLQKEGSCLDLVPKRVFANALPHSFVDEYVHWYNHDDQKVEFRSLTNAWYPSYENWSLDKHDKTWALERPDDLQLVSPSSQTAKTIAGILSPVETKLHLNMTWKTQHRTLFVHVPRRRLDFSLKQGERALVSKQFRDMQIDEDQSLGTLVGLESKLVLRSTNSLQNRKVIIPEGNITHSSGGSRACQRHVGVSVEHGSAGTVLAYSIDSLLHRLIDDGRIESKLKLAYLHALTSYCLPDPFTEQTGTERSLEILESASIRSPSRLSEKAIMTLEAIADLAPMRSFYPTHEKVMQTVEWSSGLSFLSQDSRFFTSTIKILQWTSKIDFLHASGAVPIRGNPTNNLELVGRDIARASRQCVSGFGAESFTTEYDQHYRPRDSGQQTRRAVRASEMASRAYHNVVSIPEQVASTLVKHLYEMLQDSRGQTQSRHSAPSTEEMEYDSKWLQDPKTFLHSTWCDLHYGLQSNTLRLNQLQRTVWMTTISYAKDYDAQVAQAFWALFLFNSVIQVSLPEDEHFTLSEGYGLKQPYMADCARAAALPLENTPEYNLLALQKEDPEDTLARMERSYEVNKNQAIRVFTDNLLNQWPCATPVKPKEAMVKERIDMPTVIARIIPLWNLWFSNLQFKRYLESFVSKVMHIPVGNVTVKPVSTPTTLKVTIPNPWFLSIDDMFVTRSPGQGQFEGSNLQASMTLTKVDRGASDALVDMLTSLKSKVSLEYERQYVDELRQSSTDLCQTTLSQPDEDWLSTLKTSLPEHLAQGETAIAQAFTSMRDWLLPNESAGDIERILTRANFVPRCSRIFLLQRLRSTVFRILPDKWKRTIVAYGRQVVAYQQARRLMLLQNNATDFLREIDNLGHDAWDPSIFPEWLLLECESDIKIRNVQQEIARTMTHPPENHNAVMQLNMGEGKSSVIVPMVTTALGDGSRLVIVIVAKPQAKQMHQTLISKLTGFLDRPIYELPFSRAITMDLAKAATIEDMITRCMKEGGVMMVQPEHLLSFQLMGLECGISENTQLADKLFTIEQFLDNSSRYIIDESDENFSVKFELIYTLGQQQPIEHSPFRWIIIQNVLRIVAECALSVQRKCPTAIEMEQRHGRVARIRILRADAQEQICSLVADYICENGLDGFPIAWQRNLIKDAVRSYITHLDLSSTEIEVVEKSVFWSDATKDYILLLRGLIAGGILAFAFGQKRWRVDYGVDDTRERKTRLAVPFRAKDNPAPRSEFSHPDSVIVLTCLSYYYSGLADEDLFQIFDQLVRSDSASDEYQQWVKTAPGLADAYRQLTGVNLRDRAQCISEIFPHMRYSKGAIDYFLSKMVFAKECREFPHKLSLSGWDLGKVKTNPTTGFSGTNDSRYLLPLHVKQLDLPEQRHTNALVLDYLLRPENSIALTPSDVDKTSFDSQLLLDMVRNMPRTRVILDVGAQVIDLSNKEFAKTWLKQYDGDDQPQAVVFFDDTDQIMVMDVTGSVEELQASPFATQLDQCLVFLDQAHTRGTDLKLPTDYCAAVTLGANLTKDRLVQGMYSIPLHLFLSQQTTN